MSKPIFDYSIKYQQLLRDLKCTVEGLLVGQVANVWCIYGGLNRLHNATEKIFKHGCKAISHEGSSDYWQFIQGLEWLQPNNLTSSFSLDSEYKCSIPQHLESDKASIWLYRSLETHSLSQKLSWLLTDKTHLKTCYQSKSFLCQEKYAEAVLICLRAVERNQPSLLSEIDPCLFLNKTNVSEYRKTHRRCSSFPDNRFKTIQEENSYKNSKTFHRLDVHCKKIDAPRKIIHGKLKAWRSMPNLYSNLHTSRERSKSVIQSNTTPSTPMYARRSSIKQLNTVVDGKLSSNDSKAYASTSVINSRVKHFMINNYNIVEHTMPRSSYESSTLDENLSNLSVKSLPEIQSPMNKTTIARSAPDYSFLSALAGEKDYKKQPKKSFIEDGGMSVLPMATGYFPRPIKGQTLTAFLTSGQFARANAELDRENAHFSISEAMIAAMEQIRCKRDLKLADEQIEESDEEIMDLKQRIRLRRRQKLEEKQKKMWGGSTSDGKFDNTTTTSASPCTSSSRTTSESLSSDEIDLEIDEASNLKDQKGLSMSMASLYGDTDIFKKPRGAPDGASDVLSAEGVALSLISRFNEKQLPRASDLEWLVSEEEAPQALLPLPKSWPISPDDSEGPPETPLRGTKEWAPPRPQIIFTPHPSPVRKKLMLKQNYRCAGCGMRVSPQYASRFRYCDYLGRYFCTGCHTNQLALIPGRVLQKWDFTRYPVSSFSYRLLDQMFGDPLFRIFELNKKIAKRSKNLEFCRRYRLGLYYLKDFIMTCRFAKTIQEYLENEPPHLINDPDIYSMQDLINVRNGEMKSKLKLLVEMACRHTSECELCLGRGFICELCFADEILFPWYLKKVIRCYKCGACFHNRCWNINGICVKCERLMKRKDGT